MMALPVARVGLIGQGLTLSLSPALHEAEGRHLGFDYRYKVFDTDRDPAFSDLPQMIGRLKAEGFLGSNITHPFKQEIMQYLDQVDEEAKLVGAVNTMVLREGKAIGYNTDWRGFLGSLENNFPDQDVSSVVQLGAGGAGSAVAYALLRFGVRRLVIVDIDEAKAQELADRFANIVPGCQISAAPMEDIEQVVKTSTGIVNATPVGMDTHPGLPLPRTLITPDRWVHDVVYMPVVTPLVECASSVGAAVAGGGDMVVGQASEAITLFTQKKADPARMMGHFLDLVSSGAQRRLAQ